MTSQATSAIYITPTTPSHSSLQQPSEYIQTSNKQISLQSLHTYLQNLKMPNNQWSDSSDKGATGAAKFVTSTLGNTVGGLTGTVGGIAGTATRGLGDTINSATGSTGKPVGDALGSAGSGLEDGLKNVGKGVENAGQWRK
ncbi:uncharacterized protein BDV14DRAFT_168050 [Aspergillus stella-maris]|uniref:uncharacterized protein n=1 Tax=Aspergillus stella-maris TaxID=1810926 RepID=UPI003CCCA1E4